MERLLIDLEHAQDAEVRAAALAERQRVAREMHDVLAHSLSGLALQLEGARGYLTKDAGGAEIQKALLQVVSGRAVIDPAVQRHLVEAIAVTPPSPPAGQADSPATPRPPPHPLRSRPGRFPAARRRVRPRCLG